MYIIGWFKFGQGSRFLKQLSDGNSSFDWGRHGAIVLKTYEQATLIRDQLYDELTLDEGDDLFIDEILPEPSFNPLP